MEEVDDKVTEKKIKMQNIERYVRCTKERETHTDRQTGCASASASDRSGEADDELPRNQLRDDPFRSSASATESLEW